MYLIIILTLLILLTPTIASILTLKDKYKYYRSIYNKLNSMQFERLGNLYIANYNKPDEFIWFTYSDSFKLTEEVYLHNNSVTICDPFSYYWLRKYQKYFSTYKLAEFIVAEPRI